MAGYYFKNVQCDVQYYLSMANRPTKQNKFSQFRGVSKNNNPKKPYRAYFKYKGIGYNVGAFETELEAAKAYNKLISRVVGAHAILNDIPQE
jgi:hypothetical protein